LSGLNSVIASAYSPILPNPSRLPGLPKGLTLAESYAFTMSGQGATDAGLPVNSSYTNQYHGFGGAGPTGGRFIATRSYYHLTGYLNGEPNSTGHLLANNFDALDNSDLLLCNGSGKYLASMAGYI
jgi:hypothetical protein